MQSYSNYIVDIDTIKNNLQSYKKLDSKSKICAVVKANAYGVGIKNVVGAIDCAVDCYAVANFGEAKKLRQITDKPILVLNFVRRENFNFCRNNNIVVSVGSLIELKTVLSYFKKNNYDKKLKLHFAVNTGMNRIGFCSKKDFEKAVLLAKKNENKLQIDGIFSHFYSPNNKKECKKQFCKFMQFLKILKTYFDLSKITKHISSSVASIKFPNFRLDMVRLGIVLFSKVAGLKNFESKDVTRLTSCVVQLSKVKKGEFVGYSKKYIAQKDMMVATVPLGYADGIFRQYSKYGKVLCRGKFCKIVGNICMDMFMIDVSGTNAKMFDSVVLLGCDKSKNEISTNNMANWCKTINYEILTNIKQNRLNVIVKHKKM